jgi:hypothetical protein
VRSRSRIGMKREKEEKEDEKKIKYAVSVRLW